MATTARTRVDSNIRINVDGTLACVHCDSALPGTETTVFDSLPRQEASPSVAGPHIFADPSVYVDVEVVFRQYYCPGCWTALRSEVVPRA